jgi:uncharacterized protein
VSTIGRSLSASFAMFWETLWALALGFVLSGAVQAFVSRDEMRRRLGDHRPATVATASFLGMVSSSCSYAASAMAKSLFEKGADFLTSMAFMFASTNLVIELGIVLWVLLGWQYTAAELVGGLVMIALLVLVGRLALPAAAIDDARRRLRRPTPGDPTPEPGDAAPAEPGLQAEPWRARLRSKAGWADAAGYTMSDVGMLRRELVIGFVVAGFLDAAVPHSVFRAVLFSGHGGWTSVENAVVGPLIAFVSFVCSVGNVPLALGLVQGGIRFGGVISFLFADLITFPLVLVYRRFYGTRLAIRLTLVFWAVMAAAGLIVEGLFRVVGLVPAATSAGARTMTAHVGWDPTTVLNLAMLAVLGGLWWLHRRHGRSGDAACPGCAARDAGEATSDGDGAGRGPAEQVALAVVDPEVDEHVELAGRLDPLGDHVAPGPHGEAVQALDQRLAARVAVDGPHPALVELDELGVEDEDVAQGREA